MLLTRVALVWLLSVSATGSALAACGPRCGCGGASACVEKVVCVPEWTMEQRVVTCTEYVAEQRQRAVTCYQRIPVMQQVARQYTVMVPETRTQTVSCTVYKPVYSTRTCQYQVQIPVYSVVDQPYTCSVPVYSYEDRTYTVMVPHYETRTGIRKVCRVVPVQTVQTVACDEGHWETRVQQVRCCRRGCAGSCCCGSRTICRKVWVPQIVTKEVPVTSCQTVVEDQPYEYTAVVCRPEVRTCKVRVCHVTTETRVRKVQVCHYRTELRTKTYQVCEMVPEVQTRPVSYTVCVPQVQTRICQETSYRIEPVQQVVTYTVCVPRQVQKVVCEPVCRMVKKTVLVPATCCRN